jgi:hypothetical protein
MGLANKGTLPLLLGAFVAAAACWAADPTPRDTSATTTEAMIVHEWGTFSTFSGSNGKNLKFQPYDNDLPDFVHGYQRQRSKEGPKGGTISLETPVIYFYTDRSRTASVNVKFPKGTLTEWYPHAGRTDTQLVWEGVQVRPAGEVQLPRDAKESRYYAARETDAAPLRVSFTEKDKAGAEQEKFLFYRGVGTFDMPLSVCALGDGKFTVRWSGKGPEGDLILVRVQAGKVRFRPFRLDRTVTGGARGDVQIPDEDATAEKLGEAVVKELTAKGLFEKEARAMVKTWSAAWFGEEGTRVLYVLPGELTDELLPLRVEPKPASLVRVLVGRHDVLTPEREKQIDALVATLARPTFEQDADQRAAWQELTKLGRYHGAAQREAEARLRARQ